MFQTLSIDELYEKSKKLPSNELILDVRRPDEYADAHVPGSRNISHESVLNHTSDLQKYARVYLYCRSGGRVAAACTALVQSGLKNISGVVSGGMPDWLAKGYPSER
jgi:rhodanese-related sulfurtransferase